MVDFKYIKEATVIFGYYLKGRAPIFLGSGFLIGNGDRALTCAHVIVKEETDTISNPKVWTKYIQVNGQQAEMSCWSFVSIEKSPKPLMLRYPVTRIALYKDKIDEHYFNGNRPDVAYLELDINQHLTIFPAKKPTSLSVSNKIVRTIGTEVAIIGYPSPSLLMVRSDKGEPKCLGPLVQFARLAGILPHIDVDIPEFLAFDALVAKGSSGSPIIELETGKVIAIAAQLHPFAFFETKNDTETTYNVIPSGIGFGLPSNYYYQMSLSETGEGKFNFSE
jgi:hypothetical protein